MQVRRGLFLIPVLAGLIVLGAVVAVRVGSGARPPGPPASILFSTLLSDRYADDTSVGSSGAVYLGGEDVEFMNTAHRRVRLFGFPQTTVNGKKQPPKIRLGTP